MDDDPPLAHLVFSQPTEYLRFLDEAAVWAHVCMQFFCWSSNAYRFNF